MIWRRISGAGNSFYIFDNINGRISRTKNRAQLAQKICTQFNNLKTDGLIFLEKHGDYDFEWDFYNNDGSQAEMCGNAARCVSLFYHKFVKRKEQITFKTLAGTIETQILSANKIKVVMPALSRPQQLEGYFYINTGVPHIVVAELPDKNLAKKLRPNPPPSGANITFLNGNKAVTYERGVEDFTSACGTGAVAAAAFIFYKSGQHNSIITMPGGNLEVFIQDFNTRPLLVGDAKFDFELETKDESS